MKNVIVDKNIDGELILDKYVKLIYKGTKVFTIGQTDGKFFLNLEKITPLGSEATANLILAEDSFMSMIAAALIYCEHYNIDIGKMIDELTKSESINYICPVQTETVF